VFRTINIRNIRRVRQFLTKELRRIFSVAGPRKILFDHLPKCGGLSLNTYLEAHYPRGKTFSLNPRNLTLSVNKFKSLSERDRYGYDLIKGHLAHELLDYVHPECLKVTVLREPVDRIISHYYYAKRTPRHYLYSKIHQSGMGLEEYATSGLSDELRNWYTTHFSGLSLDDVERRPEESIAKALEVILKRYDIVGFLDNFSLFLEMLRSQAKLRDVYKERVNVTQGREKLSHIEESVMNKIREVNKIDIVLYREVRALCANNHGMVDLKKQVIKTKKVV